MRRPLSLRTRLLGWLLGPLLLWTAFNAWLGYGHAVQAANEAYDRALYLAARTLAEELELTAGQVELHLGRSAGYLLANHTGARLFYKVQAPDGRVLAGQADLPDPVVGKGPPVRYFALVQFDDAHWQGEPVRLARLTHVLPAASPWPLVQLTVAETLELREQLIAQVWREALISQGWLLLGVTLLVVWGVQRGLRPLQAWRARLAERADDDVAPIEVQDAPRELRPLFAALNHHMQRLDHLIALRRRFLDSAAHQLRTPLTALKTQLALARRLPPVPDAAQAPAPATPDQAALLASAQQTTDHAVRLTEQLLMLARAEHAPELGVHERLDLCALARQVLQERLWRAHASGHDLGLSLQLEQRWCVGSPELLHEAMANLVDNALVHTPAGTVVTLQVDAQGFEVQDDGPGIGAAHLPHIFDRFYRGAAAGVPGSGLGLSIVREIAQQHGAQLQAISPWAQGRGACLRWRWPETPDAPAPQV